MTNGKYRINITDERDSKIDSIIYFDSYGEAWSEFHKLIKTTKSSSRRVSISSWLDDEYGYTVAAIATKGFAIA